MLSHRKSTVTTSGSTRNNKNPTLMTDVRMFSLILKVDSAPFMPKLGQLSCKRSVMSVRGTSDTQEGVSIHSRCVVALSGEMLILIRSSSVQVGGGEEGGNDGVGGGATAIGTTSV